MRQQHYRFAHQHLKDQLLRDPAGFWAAASAQGAAMLQHEWAAAGEGLGPQDRADGAGLSIAPMSPSPGVEALLITLPPPQFPAECHFIALVKVDGGAPRYFVAERGADGAGGVPRAFWAEWKRGPGGAVMRVRGEDLPAIHPDALLAAAVAECRGAPPAPAPGPGPGAGQGVWAMAGAPAGSGMPNMGPPSPGPFAGFGQPPAAWSGLPAVPPRGRAASGPGRGVLFGCGGAIALVLFVGGFLLYQEELRGLYVPTSEAGSAPVTPGGPFAVEALWDGTGYAHNNIWLVVEEGTKSGGDFRVNGTISCKGSERKITVKLTDRHVHDLEDEGASGFSAWLHLESEYTHSSSRPLRCTGVLEPAAGTWTKGRVVITHRQRPSDFFAF